MYTLILDGMMVMERKIPFVKVYFKDRCDVISLLSTVSDEAGSQGKGTMINSITIIARKFHWTKVLPAQLPFGLQKFSVEINFHQCSTGCHIPLCKKIVDKKFSPGENFWLYDS